ncbi:hypothetical protein [Parafrankia sp. EUN1f]|uniref:hypothetical protein n=1 Tax=Parafrankia sp. EUN1f TaxID=102897 RepID=UPI001E5C4CBE|nr:hypothetical protein [Parafrankia sp. EUN1f]
MREGAVAFATGGVTFLASTLLDGDWTWTTMLSAFIAGVSLIVQHQVALEKVFEDGMHAQADKLVEISRDVDRKLDETRQEVARELETMNHGARLLEQLESSAVETAVEGARPVSGLVDRLARFSPPNPILGRLVADEIRGLHELLRGLEGESVTFPGEDRDWLLALTRSARGSILATSTTNVDGGRRNFSDGFWNSELGRAYLMAQREAVNRGVKVHRVFILNTERILRNGDFLKIREEQEKAGIKVHSVVVPGGGHTGSGVTGWRKTFRDFILFDESVSYEVEAGALQGASITSTKLWFDRTRIGDRKALFDEIWQEAAAAEAAGGTAGTGPG